MLRRLNIVVTVIKKLAGEIAIDAAELHQLCGLAACESHERGKRGGDVWGKGGGSPNSKDS